MAENFDPCECVYNHESNMDRLLSYIRQGQGYCTDSNCVNDMPNIEPSSGLDVSTTLMVSMAAWATVSIGMYLYNYMLNRDPVGKPSSNNRRGNDDEPPAVF